MCSAFIARSTASLRLSSAVLSSRSNSSSQQHTKAALNSSTVSGALRSASAMHPRSAGEGDSRSSSREKWLIQSCQSSGVNRSRVSHALASFSLFRWCRLVTVSSTVVSRTPGGGSVRFVPPYPPSTRLTD